MELEIINQPRVMPRQLYQRVKRLIDVIFCILIMPFALIIIAACALAIYLDSRGPIFFIQERIGKGGRHFRIYKFRTMKPFQQNNRCRSFMKAYINGEITGSNSSVFKPIQNNEITRVGAFLRKTSLDEIPQIYNVLKGEMSIVGPRPNVIWEIEEYRPWHYERLEILPGITGLAQVRGRSSIGFNSLARFDINYIENQCFSLDIKIFWWTITAILDGKGAL
jgi:lipopolysaccharide/colanic/teichoic acid biosynthesis glycosyltransferase